jgi:hypothetical protein
MQKITPHLWTDRRMPLKEAAALSGCGVRRIYSWIDRGVVPVGVSDPMGHLFFSLADLAVMRLVSELSDNAPLRLRQAVEIAVAAEPHVFALVQTLGTAKWDILGLPDGDTVDFLRDAHLAVTWRDGRVNVRPVGRLEGAGVLMEVPVGHLILDVIERAAAMRFGGTDRLIPSDRAATGPDRVSRA